MSDTFSIIIEKLEFDTIIGILPSERKNPQRIIIDAIFEYQDKNFLDYVLVKDKIKELFITNKYFLLEDAIKDISSSLKKEFFCLKTMKISIKKPDILDDCIVGIKTKITF
ncbi:MULTISPECIES: dihydroneopterin aldolase [unclassified Helicobacter]|uniref:dihydroneopterin aldolase n=1 Tax=unclassified Helicobacter TaxID=2593540 RepID=UPI000CF10F38|nr:MULTISPECIES: dihydroneopterin aldolase [unclassified Helicobacter]